MKKLCMLCLCLALLLGAVAQADTLMGIAYGYGGDIVVAVTMDGETMTAIDVLEHSETEGIGTLALDSLPDAIVAAGGTGVDAVAGATITSEALIAAVNNALDPVLYPYEDPALAEGVPDMQDANAYAGFGVTSFINTERNAFSQLFAGAVFNGMGRIVGLHVDQLEVPVPANGDALGAEVSGWRTKRELGDAYILDAGSWAAQMDAVQALFLGMTVDEVAEWIDLYCSDVDGRPLRAGSENEQDAAKYDALSGSSQDMLADVASSATISLRGSYGDLAAALRSAYEGRETLSVLIQE